MYICFKKKKQYRCPFNELELIFIHFKPFLILIVLVLLYNIWH